MCAAQERCTKLEDELTHLTGQQNLNQRIQYHKKIKDENGELREELGRLRIEAHRSQVGWRWGGVTAGAACMPGPCSVVVSGRAGEDVKRAVSG